MPMSHPTSPLRSRRAAALTTPPGRPSFRAVRTLLALLLVAGGLAGGGVFGGASPAAGAEPEVEVDPPGRVDIIEVRGRIDPVVADFIGRSLTQAIEGDDEVLVIQLDSPGDLISESELDELVERITFSPVPVAIWVGPTGARAYGGAFRLLSAAPVAGMAPGTKIGKGEGVTGTVGSERALTDGLIDMTPPTLGEFVVGLDGRAIGVDVVRTARDSIDDQGRPRREVAGEVRFGKLSILERLLHAAARPSVTYLLLLVGISLLIFEFFSAGIGVAGATGAILLVMSAYGLAVLPTSPLSLAMIALAFFGFSIDVQAGAPRLWTAIATVSLVVGSLRLFGEGIDVPLLTMLALVIGVVLLMVSGMTSMLRSRFSTPTIGRESMIGRMGQARSAVAPDGTVVLDGGLWRARTNRATPIAVGDPVRVVAIDGLVLEVEPEEGGARDAGH